MAGWSYYARKPYFDKGWQRITAAIGMVTTATAVGVYLQRAVELRYSRFRGRTSLHGDSSVRSGWLEVEPK